MYISHSLHSICSDAVVAILNGALSCADSRARLVLLQRSGNRPVREQWIAAIHTAAYHYFLRFVFFFFAFVVVVVVFVHIILFWCYLLVQTQTEAHTHTQTFMAERSAIVRRYATIRYAAIILGICSLALLHNFSTFLIISGSWKKIENKSTNELDREDAFGFFYYYCNWNFALAVDTEPTNWILASHSIYCII